MSRPHAEPVPPPRRDRRRVLVAVGVALAVAVVAVVVVVVLLVRGSPAGPSGAEPTGAATPPTPSPTPTPSQAPEPEPGAPAVLTWAPPELVDPETVELSAENRSVTLEPDRDYVLELPDEPVEVRGGITVEGGRNVVLVGGEIRVGEEGEGNDRRALLLRDQTGTVHVEGLLLSGPGLAEGINLDQRLGAVVQLQNIRVETVHGEEDGHHADVLQTWAGPAELRIDRLSGRTTYQGFFLLPLQHGDQDAPRLFDLRNIDLVGEDGAGYLLWRDDADWPLAAREVWVAREGSTGASGYVWDDGSRAAADWAQVRTGTPPDGPFVPEGSVGVGYTSPGYADGPPS